MPRRTFRYDPATQSMVEVHRAPPDFSVPGVVGDIAPFVSPIDGTVISSRSQLRDYMGDRDLVFYDDVKNGEGKEVDRYAQRRQDTALRERLWEYLDKAQRTGKGPRQ